MPLKSPYHRNAIIDLQAYYKEQKAAGTYSPEAMAKAIQKAHRRGDRHTGEYFCLVTCNQRRR